MSFEAWAGGGRWLLLMMTVMRSIVPSHLRRVQVEALTLELEGARSQTAAAERSRRELVEETSRAVEESRTLLGAQRERCTAVAQGLERQQVEAVAGVTAAEEAVTQIEGMLGAQMGLLELGQAQLRGAMASAEGAAGHVAQHLETLDLCAAAIINPPPAHQRWRSEMPVLVEWC
jgi:hypothetical protein